MSILLTFTHHALLAQVIGIIPTIWKNIVVTMQVFNDRILSLSDEAFLLVVLINYSAEWMWKIEMEMTEVRNIKNRDMWNNCLFKLTNSVFYRYKPI